MSSTTQEDGFTEVTHGLRKRKASSSPTLPSQPKSGPSEPPLGTPVHPKSNPKNKIPVILSGVDREFKNWRSIMDELRQYHPGLKVSQIKELQKGDYLVIGDSMQDIIIIQSETKMKAALGKNVKVSLPKAFQANKTQTKNLVTKGVPTDITDKEFLDLNKINHTKAECLKSKKDGRVLPIFQLEINDPTKSETLLSQNLICQVTGIVYKVEEFRMPVLFTLCYNFQSFSHLAKNCRSKQKCLICVESDISTKDARIRKLGNPSVPTVRGHMLCHIKGVWNTKSRHSGNMW